MCTDRLPLYCIIPPHMLHAMLENESETLKTAARRTLLASVRLRERRSLISRLGIGSTTGEKRRTIYDMKNEWRFPGDLARSEDGPKSSDPAVNEAFDGLGATYDLFRDVFNRNSLDGHGMRLDASVHYGEDYDNAFWDGQRMVFGDGDGILFQGFTKAIDVIGHELTHGVVEFTANLEYHKESGALNESFADVFGSLVKQYPRTQAKDADWLIGQGLFARGINAVALRSMKEPGSAYDDPTLGGKDPQPGHMHDYVHLPDSEDGDWGGVHINSGIPNHAFYLTAMKLGGNAWDDAGHIWYAGLQRLWSTAGFSDCAAVTIETAGTLFGTGSRQQKVVQEAWTEVGVPVAGRAPRRVPVGSGASGAAGGDANGVQFRRQLERVSREIQKIIETMPEPSRR